MKKTQEILNIFKDFVTDENRADLEQKVSTALNDPQFKDRIYREVELGYRKQDAAIHLEERAEYVCDVDNDLYLFLSDAINNDGILEELARRFLEDYDCNITENDQWDDLIDQYIMYNRKGE